MFNTKILRSTELPKTSGLVCHINRYGEVVGMTATRDASERCNASKMIRCKQLADAKNIEYFMSSQADGGKGMSETNAKLLTKYPEGWENFTFSPMPFDQADYYCKQGKKFLKQKAIAEGLVNDGHTMDYSAKVA